MVGKLRFSNFVYKTYFKKAFMNPNIDLLASCYGKVKDVKYDIAILPWGIEYITFKKLLIILNSTTRRKVNSKNSTAKNSEISKNEESFKKEATPIIISPLENVNTDQALNQDDEIVLKLKKKWERLILDNLL